MIVLDTFAEDLARLRKMNERFIPKPENIIDAARNIRPDRTPLYEHSVDRQIIEAVLGEPLKSLREGDALDEYYKKYIGFFRFMGYDYAVLEVCLTHTMPGSGALMNERPGVITDPASFNAYPWGDIPRLFKDKAYPEYESFLKNLPSDMTAIGGPGNGLFECVEDLTGFESLCYIRCDEPELYADLFKRMAEVQFLVWRDFMKEFGNGYGVLRFGDDLGFKSNTMLSESDIQEHILPGYSPIVKLVHSYRKPFLLHSCGCIFNVMDELISKVGINAKHSNEDAIAPIERWVAQYNDRIGIFGGIDVDMLCRGGNELTERIESIYHLARRSNGYAFGTGNSIAWFVPPERYVHMVRVFRELRGE